MFINNYINYINSIDIYLLIDDIKNEELINKTKNDIMGSLSSSIIVYFHIRQNYPEYREGLIYKEEVIDKLDQYEDNDLILFLHTKGVTNKKNIENLLNTYEWITIMYFFNICSIKEILTRIYNEKNIITYGTLYNYSKQSKVKYKWMYMGAFHYIYPHRLLEYFKEKNISLNDVKANYNDEQNIKLCAEAFIGDNIDLDHIGFMDDYMFNKYYDPLKYDKFSIGYDKIRYVLSNFCMVKNINICYNTYLNILNKFSNEITNDL